MKSIKQRLADRVNKDLKLPVLFEAADFSRNFGARATNDWCLWTATAGSIQLASWTSMTELVKQKEPLHFVTNKNEIGPKEIA